MEQFLNELIGFSVVVLVVLMLAYLTHKLEKNNNQKESDG